VRFGPPTTNRLTAAVSDGLWWAEAHPTRLIYFAGPLVRFDPPMTNWLTDTRLLMGSGGLKPTLQG